VTAESHKARLILEAKQQGFELARVADPALLPIHQETLDRWLAAGMHGEMHYLNKRANSAIGLDAILPGTQSVLVLGANYFHGEPDPPTETSGRVSEYARTRDYHKSIKARLKRMDRIVQELGGASRYYVDTGPVFERGFAESAGLGYVGKNTCVITQEFGSWVFLAVMFLTLELPADQNALKLSCGSCRRCLDICPTQAIGEDLTVDARRCISYLTIESRGPIPLELREGMGEWVFGCDLCQDVCPHNHRANLAATPDFSTPRLPSQVPLRSILEIADDAEFLARFAGTPLMRAKRVGLLRNACVAAGNSGDASLIPLLSEVAEREGDLVAEHALWAIAQLSSRSGDLR